MPDFFIMSIIEALSGSTHRVVVEDSGIRLSASALLGEAFAVGHRLEAASRPGIEGREPALILWPRSAHSVSLIFGAAFSGHAFVPLDERLPPGRLSVSIQPLGACLLLVHPSLEGLARQAFGDNRAVTAIVLSEADLSVQTQRLQPGPRSPQDAAYIMFTSGTTGIPKAVPVSWQALIEMTEWMEAEAPVSAQAVLGLSAEFGFDLCIPDLFMFQREKRRISILPREILSFPESLARELALRAVTSIIAVPSLLKSLAKSSPMHTIPISRIISIGETLTPKTFSDLARLFPEAAVYNMYGPTEACFCCTSHLCTAEDSTAEEIPIGTARSGSSVSLSGDAGHPPADGQIGEIIISGTCISDDYLGNEEASSRAYFLKEDGGRAYHSGDRALLCAGQLLFRGRADNQVKFKGYRIELTEIEMAVSRWASNRMSPGATGSIPQPCESVVLALEDEGIIACLYTAEEELDSRAMVASLRTQLPAYMIPRHIQRTDTLPLTPNGKVDRHGCAQIIRNSRKRGSHD